MLKYRLKSRGQNSSRSQSQDGRNCSLATGIDLTPMCLTRPQAGGIQKAQYLD